MRLFFGLQPDPVAAMAIAEWRDRRLPLLPRPVPAANLHMTLLFLGDLDPRSTDRLCAGVGGLAHGPIKVTLDRLGYWPGPQILWLGPSADSTTPLLARSLRKAAREAGVQVERREYRAHLTLSRRAPAPPAQVTEPRFNLEFADFHLFESVRGAAGVRYEVLVSWRLA